jgi:hypothetical protein
MIRLFFAAFILGSLSMIQPEEFSFANYSAPVATIASPKINLKSHSIGPKYRTQIRYTVNREGVNFAGHYTVVTWGCGTNCSLFAVVNLRAGKIWHDPRRIASRGFAFKPDSRLFILNPWEGRGDFLPQSRPSTFSGRARDFDGSAWRNTRSR